VISKLEVVERDMRLRWLLIMLWVALGIVATAGKACAAEAAHGSGKTPNPIEHVLDEEILLISGYKIWTKYMVLELIAAVLILLIFIPLARRARSGEPPRGGWQNAFEVLLTFIRDEVAKPNLGEHDADRHVPFLWTVFLFVLFCNLLGMFPFGGSPTANIWVTGGLAVCSFIAIHAAAVAKMGLAPYLKSLWPHLDIPIPVAGFVIKCMIFVIEIIGNFIRGGVLAVRLFANMLAGHSVLAMIMLFIVMASNAAIGLWATITVASVLGVVALSLLEIFVAFLQAYIFVFLTALFMGMAVHPQH
jgi:F-type H+-transporting ATPase subunit a